MPNRCPNCGNRLKLEVDSRRRRFVEMAYYGLVQQVKEFSVIRIFYICDNRKLGAPSEITFTEMLQHWIGEDGKDTVRARSIAMFPYYRTCPFSLNSALSLKRESSRRCYHHFSPDGFYARWKCFDKIRRNGFRGDFHGFNPEDVFCNLLLDNRFETLWKLGLFDMAEYYLYNGKKRVVKYWRQVLQLRTKSVRDYGIWFDYLDLLEYFHKDVRNPGYVFPQDLDAEHDRLVRKKRDIEARLELERRKLQEKEKLAVLEGKSRYFGITFGNDTFIVVVLKSLEEYQREGYLQHHCVYTNGYYGKKDSLVLSARKRDAPDKPVETVEISLKTGKILQCFGACNQFTEYHDEIKNLVNKNSYKYLKK